MPFIATDTKISVADLGSFFGLWKGESPLFVKNDGYIPVSKIELNFSCVLCVCER
jgi:hypothetical protein